MVIHGRRDVPKRTNYAIIIREVVFLDKVFIIDRSGSVKSLSKDCVNCEFYMRSRFASFKCIYLSSPYYGEAVGPYFSCDYWELADRIVETLTIKL